MQSAQLQDLRLESRSNIFVMAALYATGRSVTPVRVRNLSRAGALVEATALPAPGTNVRLSRASLSALGTVMWVEGGKAGLQFEAPIAIAEWLPQGKRGIGQQFVDELFHQKRLQSGRAAEDGLNTTDVADALIDLRQSLERATEELALDALVASRHLVSLQAIDGVAQALARLAAEAVIQEKQLSR